MSSLHLTFHLFLGMAAAAVISGIIHCLYRVGNDNGHGRFSGSMNALIFMLTESVLVVAAIFLLALGLSIGGSPIWNAILGYFLIRIPAVLVGIGRLGR